MGGYGALRYLLAHPDLFRAAIALSPAVYYPLPPSGSSTREFGAFGKGSVLFDEAVYTEKNYPALFASFEAANLPAALYIAVGDDEDSLVNPAEAMHDLDYEAHTVYNKARRVKNLLVEMRVLDGGHNWDVWRPGVLEGLRYIHKFLKAG
jgi:S-formylglutathione hydrolase FrmB